jgi:hypothetical protein
MQGMAFSAFKLQHEISTCPRIPLVVGGPKARFNEGQCQNNSVWRQIQHWQWRKSWWGGRPPPPPHLHGKLTNFRKFWPKRGLKTVFSSANVGGGVCRKFESFVGSLGGFAPPPEKVNFRHWTLALIEIWKPPHQCINFSCGWHIVYSCF